MQHWFAEDYHYPAGVHHCQQNAPDVVSFNPVEEMRISIVEGKGKERQGRCKVVSRRSRETICMDESSNAVSSNTPRIWSPKVSRAARLSIFC